MSTVDIESVGLDPNRFAEVALAVEAQLGRVIVGQTDLVRAVLVCLFSEGHVLLEGVPGLGKTQLLKTLGAAIELPFSRIQFTPDLMPADITGTQVLEQAPDGSRHFEFRAGPIFAGLVLADEINRATPKTQSALLEAMQERTVTVAGATRALPSPFLVMATQNPLDSEGTYPLPEAQLDRFMMKVLVPFPSGDELDQILTRTTGTSSVAVEPVINTSGLRTMVDFARGVPVPAHVQRHAVDLVVATHPDRPESPESLRQYVRFGASPRGAQALILAGKVAALIDGRPSVATADIRSLAEPILRHRLVLGYEAIADGVSADSLVGQVLEHVPDPPAGVRGAP